ncbi:MAG: Organic solvent tolerance protein OstA [Reichenbachiella sp.]
MRILTFIVLLFSMVVSNDLFAQKRNKIRYRAEKLINVRDGDLKYKKLMNKVVFKQGDTRVQCDSAYFFQKENRMEGYGRVRIKDGDSVTITAKKLIYEGNTEMALLRENVIYRRGKKRLYTDFLDYNLITEVAEFSNDGKLVDENNTLTSSYGVYHSTSEQAFFYDDVLLVSPDFNLRSDTLEYSSRSKVAISTGPTFIDDREGTTVDSNGGTYRTMREQTTFKNGTIETRNYIIVGDNIFIDENKKYYKATGNVVMTSKKDQIVLTGDEAVYQKLEGISKVYGTPVMRKFMENEDTLYMSADTLVAIENVDKDKERVLGYYDILIYQNALQGKCDSLAYFLSDSTIHMFHDPVLWNETSQMVADSISLTFKNDLLYKMNLNRQSFLASLDTMGQYNQIKGRRMIGYFDEEGEMETMDVNGNGESHYFVMEGDSLFLGMNKMFCSTMTIRFKDNSIRNISFYNQPEAKFIPPLELNPELEFLEGFEWRIEEKPSREDVLQGDLMEKNTKDHAIDEKTKSNLESEVLKKRERPKNPDKKALRMQPSPR